MIQRVYLEQIKTRINEPRRFIQVLVGTRQVGKTTLITQLLEQISIEYISVSADAVLISNSSWMEQTWETARLKLKTTQSSELLLVIDEVQKIGNWSEFVKQQWDKDTREGRTIKVILLGSSRLLIQKGLTESLAGRLELMHINHWTFTEMEAAFGWNIEQYIYFGAYP